MNVVNIAVDVFPYTQNIWSVSDYSGEQIYSKLALPLFRYLDGSVQPYAAEYYQQYANKVVIFLKENLFWSNGDKVTSHDYARAIHHILHNENNRYQKLLLSVIRHPNGVEVTEDHALVLNTSWYDPFVIHYLSLINFSPMHISVPNLHAGPYELKNKSDKYYELEENPFFPEGKNEWWVRNINYKLLPTDPEASAYHRGEIHVSCDTSLNLHSYRKSLRNSDFHKGNDTLVMLLSPGNKFKDLPFDILNLVRYAIDREEISALYDCMLEPVESWLSLYKENFYRCDSTPPFRQLSSVKIDVAFEDFYPNKEILQQLAVQLSKYNIYLDLHEDKYGCWINDCHFRFEIRKIPKSSPIQLLRSDISRLTDKSKFYKEIKDEYKKLYSLEYKDRVFDIFRNLDFYARQQVLYLPLFIFPTGYFCNSNIQPSSLMMPGNHILIKGEV